MKFNFCTQVFQTGESIPIRTLLTCIITSFSIKYYLSSADIYDFYFYATFPLFLATFIFFSYLYIFQFKKSIFWCKKVFIYVRKQKVRKCIYFLKTFLGFCFILSNIRLRWLKKLRAEDLQFLT